MSFIIYFIIVIAATFFSSVFLDLIDLIDKTRIRLRKFIAIIIIILFLAVFLSPVWFEFPEIFQSIMTFDNDKIIRHPYGLVAFEGSDEYTNHMDMYGMNKRIRFSSSMYADSSMNVYNIYLTADSSLDLYYTKKERRSYSAREHGNLFRTFGDSLINVFDREMKPQTNLDSTGFLIAFQDFSRRFLEKEGVRAYIREFKTARYSLHLEY